MIFPVHGGISMLIYAWWNVQNTWLAHQMVSKTQAARVRLIPYDLKVNMVIVNRLWKI